MIVIKEMNLRDFDTWSGATDTVSHLTHEELDTIEENINELYPDGISETQVNDILWFERELIAEWLGYNDFDEIIER